VSAIIKSNFQEKCTYVEPFAGGAGLAIKLLLLNEVKNVIINDLDRSIYCMWDCIINKPDELIRFIDETTLTLNEWEGQRQIYRNQLEYDNQTIGMATFYLNRTNRSGIIGGGLIGGRGQDGKYRMSARFSKEGLKGKIRAISSSRHRIALYNLDAKELLDIVAPSQDSSFVYFDPPYVSKGPELYSNSFSENDHCKLGEKIKDFDGKWVITYDECELIREIYTGYNCRTIPIQYSAYKSIEGSELFISSMRTALPE
jgi:DNA adenine methylase